MSSDNQYTSLGPAVIGFQTNSTSIDVGADIAGNAVGIRGKCSGAGDGNGVEGYGSGSWSGVAGNGGQNAGTGVWGMGNGGGPGVRGIGAGGPNTSPGTSVGVYGQGGSDSADGVQGIGGSGSPRGSTGVRGISPSSSTDGNGVIGEAENGTQAFGVWGVSSSGFAGYFSGKVHVQGDFSVSGAKSAVVSFPDGSQRRLYCLESPENWFEDFGFGQLVKGQAQIQLDPDFAAIVNTDTYHVFITEYEDHNALYVTQRTSTGFEVRAKTSTAGGTFSYRIVAKRKDNALMRLEKVLLPDKKL